MADPDKIRMWALVGCFVAIAYVIYGAVDAILSEPLDDPTIRGVYKQSDTMVTNPKAGNLGDFLKTRLDENYMRVGSVISVVPEKPEQVTPVSMNKAQMIEYTLKGAEIMTVKNYDHKLLDIKFSKDGKYAYVSNTEVSSGTLNITEGENVRNVPFNSASACIDTLTLVRAVVVFVRSECQNKLALLQ